VFYLKSGDILNLTGAASALINHPTDETDEEWTQLYPSFSIIAYIPRNSGASPFSDIILPAAATAAAAEWPE